MKRLILAAAIALIAALPVDAQLPVATYGGGIDKTDIFVTNSTIPGTATTISFGTNSAGGAVTCTKVSIYNGSTTASLYVQFNGTAATTGSGNLRLLPGVGYQYVGSPIHSISIIGSASGDPYTVLGN